VTILVVDDSRAMRMIVMRSIRQAGYPDHEVVQAEDGQVALDAITAGLQPELVLCDWNMPNLSGMEFLQALRATGSTVPFGFVTSEGTALMRQQARAAGALFLLAKPFTIDGFAAELTRVL
jgi:two-component system chemotaxis response regulator CheY